MRPKFESNITSQSELSNCFSRILAKIYLNNSFQLFLDVLLNLFALKAQYWPLFFTHLCCCFGFHGSEASIVIKEFYSGRKRTGLLSLFVGRLAMRFIEENNINYWPTPAESPDLNPIEMIWHELKSYLRRFVKPTNKEQLVNGIQEFWQTVTPEKCQRYIGHLRKVVPEVIRREGRASGY